MHIIHTDPTYLIIEKPAGLLVHDAPGRPGELTLVQEILKYDPAIAKVGDPARPGIVHRLDREVSGLMVIARTQEMYDHLVKQFKDRKIKKLYTALVHGKISRDEGEIRFPIARSAKGGRMAARPVSQASGGQAPALRSARVHPAQAKDAVTAFDVLKRWPHQTLLAVEPKTGRTHQIRAHLSARGHPIVGDDLYWTKNVKGKKKAPRLMLHATKLGFMDLDGVWREFVSEVPRDFYEKSQ